MNHLFRNIWQTNQTSILSKFLARLKTLQKWIFSKPYFWIHCLNGLTWLNHPMQSSTFWVRFPKPAFWKYWRRQDWWICPMKWGNIFLIPSALGILVKPWHYSNPNYHRQIWHHQVDLSHHGGDILLVVQSSILMMVWKMLMKVVGDSSKSLVLVCVQVWLLCRKYCRNPLNYYDQCKFSYGWYEKNLFYIAYIALKKIYNYHIAHLETCQLHIFV